MSNSELLSVETALSTRTVFVPVERAVEAGSLAPARRASATGWSGPHSPRVATALCTAYELQDLSLLLIQVYVIHVSSETADQLKELFYY